MRPVGSDAGTAADAGPEDGPPFAVLEWSRAIGSSAGLDAFSEAVFTRGGDVVVAGVTLSESVGGLLLGAAGVPKNVVFKLTGAAGEPAWAVVEAGLGGAMVADAEGGVIVRGAESLLRIAPSGAVDWRRERAPGHLSALALGADGAIYAAGHAPSDAPGAGSARDLVVAQHDRDGQLVWVRRFAGEGSVLPVSIATTPDGDVMVAGMIDAPLALGGDTVAVGSAALRAGFLAKLSASGEGRWAEPVAIGERTSLAGAGVAEDGSIFVAGTAYHSAGSVPLRESFLMRVAPGGAVRWERRFPLAGRVRAAVVDGQGGIVLAGRGDGGDVGGGAFFRGASFVARYRRDGSFLGQVVREDDSRFIALAAAERAVAAVGHVDVRDTTCEIEAPDCDRYGLVDVFRMLSVD